MLSTWVTNIAFLMASRFLIVEEIILTFVANSPKVYFPLHPDMDGKWQKALERKPGIGSPGWSWGGGVDRTWKARLREEMGA